MMKPFRSLHPSLETGSSLTETRSVRTSLYDSKDDFIARIAPFGVAAFYFGSFTLTPQDVPLSRQALFKLSFLNRQFLQAGGLRIVVHRHTAILSGTVTSPSLVLLGEILAQQIEGIEHVQNETQVTAQPEGAATAHLETAREAAQLLFATDQTLRSGVRITPHEGMILLQGEVSSVAQKNWAEQLAHTDGVDIQSRLEVSASTTFAAPPTEPPPVDDESLQALVLFRLRLVRETEHVPVRVKASRGIVTLSGKVRSEALRQRVENIARSTLGLRELRSSLSIAA